MLGYNMVVAAKPPNSNFSLPAPIRDAFYEMADTLGKKDRWVVISAAILMLLEADEPKRRAYFGRVYSAKVGEGFASLVDKAKERKLAGEIGSGQIKMGAVAGGKATTTATGSRSSESTPRSSQGREKRYVQRDAAGAFVEPGQSREQKRKPRV
jgi:hypothetical protein